MWKGKPAIELRMEASSFFVAALVDPLFLTFDKETKKYLNNSNVKYFGLPSRIGLSYRNDGVSIYFLSFNEFQNEISREETLEKVRSLNSQYDHIVIYAHWANEYEKEARKDIRDFAHALTTAGADLIIGSHSHVIGEKEIYKDVPIYYSLGNFVFDQYWDEDVSTGLLVKFRFSNNEIELEEEIEIRNTRDGKVILLNN